MPLGDYNEGALLISFADIMADYICSVLVFHNLSFLAFLFPVFHPATGLDVLFEVYRQVREELNDYAVDAANGKVRADSFYAVVAGP